MSWRITGRGLRMLLIGFLFFWCAVSMKIKLLLLAPVCIALAFLYAAISSLWTGLTLRVESEAQPAHILRGENSTVTVTLSHRSLLPAGRALLQSREETKELVFKCFSPVAYETEFLGRHVGKYEMGPDEIEVRDLFYLCRFRVKCAGTAQLMVLPRAFPIDKPEVNAGEDGLKSLPRSQEDFNAPDDTRAYREGDTLKRVHWKLSARRMELVVRKYETPAPPDTLILLDTGVPDERAEAPAVAADLRDALCETAVAVAKMQMEDESPVRLPLHGAQAVEFAADHARSLESLQEMLACQNFDRAEPFEEVLHAEMRRMQRTGAVVVLSSRLNAAIAEAICDIRRMGPGVRLYLVTGNTEDPEYKTHILLLQRHFVEVCFVTPA